MDRDQAQGSDRQRLASPLPSQIPSDSSPHIPHRPRHGGRTRADTLLQARSSGGRYPSVSRSSPQVPQSSRLRERASPEQRYHPGQPHASFDPSPLGPQYLSESQSQFSAPCGLGERASPFQTNKKLPQYRPQYSQATFHQSPLGLQYSSGSHEQAPVSRELGESVGLHQAGRTSPASRYQPRQSQTIFRSPAVKSQFPLDSQIQSQHSVPRRLPEQFTPYHPEWDHLQSRIRPQVQGQDPYSHTQLGFLESPPAVHEPLDLISLQQSPNLALPTVRRTPLVTAQNQGHLLPFTPSLKPQGVQISPAFGPGYFFSDEPTSSSGIKAPEYNHQRSVPHEQIDFKDFKRPKSPPGPVLIPPIDPSIDLRRFLIPPPPREVKTPHKRERKISGVLKTITKTVRKISGSASSQRKQSPFNRPKSSPVGLQDGRTIDKPNLSEEPFKAFPSTTNAAPENDNSDYETEEDENNDDQCLQDNLIRPRHFDAASNAIAYQSFISHNRYLVTEEEEETPIEISRDIERSPYAPFGSGQASPSVTGSRCSPTTRFSHRAVPTLHHKLVIHPQQIQEPRSAKHRRHQLRTAEAARSAATANPRTPRQRLHQRPEFPSFEPVTKYTKETQVEDRHSNLETYSPATPSRTKPSLSSSEPQGHVFNPQQRGSTSNIRGRPSTSSKSNVKLPPTISETEEPLSGDPESSISDEGGQRRPASADSRDASGFKKDWNFEQTYRDISGEPSSPEQNIHSSPAFSDISPFPNPLKIRKKTPTSAERSKVQGGALVALKGTSFSSTPDQVDRVANSSATKSTSHQNDSKAQGFSSNNIKAVSRGVGPEAASVGVLLRSDRSVTIVKSGSPEIVHVPARKAPFSRSITSGKIEALVKKFEEPPLPHKPSQSGFHQPVSLLPVSSLLVYSRPGTASASSNREQSPPPPVPPVPERSNRRPMPISNSSDISSVSLKGSSAFSRRSSGSSAPAVDLPFSALLPHKSETAFLASESTASIHFAEMDLLQVGPSMGSSKAKAVEDARHMQRTVMDDAKRKGRDPPKYLLLELIGKGSFGRVYKGKDLSSAAIVAVKIIDLDESDTLNPRLADTYSEFMKEVNALKILNDTRARNINHVIEALPVGKSMWMITEYCGGGSIATLMRPTPRGLMEKWIIPILREVAVAVKWVHQAGIIHRDIKCANVLITEEGGVQLCDFGVAGITETSVDKRSTFVGTPNWMAPELFASNPQYGKEVDIWAFGSMAYEMATGFPPNAYSGLQGAELGSLLKEHIPRLEGGSYSDGIRSMVAFCLEENVVDRPNIEAVQRHQYIHNTSSQYPTTSLTELVMAFKKWEDSGGSRKSLFMMGGAQGPSDVSQSILVDDSWNFSTTEAFDQSVAERIEVQDVINVYGNSVDMTSEFTDVTSRPVHQTPQQTRDRPSRRRPPPEALAPLRPPLQKVFDPNTMSNYEDNSRMHYSRDFPFPASESVMALPNTILHVSDLPLRDDTAQTSIRDTMIDLGGHDVETGLSSFPNMDTIRPTRHQLNEGEGDDFGDGMMHDYSRPALSDPAENLNRRTQDWKFPSLAASAEPEPEFGRFPNGSELARPRVTLGSGARPTLVHHPTEPIGIPTHGFSNLMTSAPSSPNRMSLIDLDLSLPEPSRPSTADSSISTGPTAPNPFEFERHASTMDQDPAREPSLYYNEESVPSRMRTGNPFQDMGDVSDFSASDAESTYRPTYNQSDGRGHYPSLSFDDPSFSENEYSESTMPPISHSSNIRTRAPQTFDMSHFPPLPPPPSVEAMSGQAPPEEISSELHRMLENFTGQLSSFREVYEQLPAGRERNQEQRESRAD